MDILDELNAFQDALGRPPEFNDTTDLPMRAAQEITKLRTKLAEREWISCADRLPELKDDSVIAYFSNNASVEMVHIQDSFKDITNGFDEHGNQLYTKWYLSQTITHWQPLPAAPINASPNER